MERTQRQGQKCFGILEIALVHMVRHQRIWVQGTEESSLQQHWFTFSSRPPWRSQIFTPGNQRARTSCQDGRQCLSRLFVEDPPILKTSNKQEDHSRLLWSSLCLQSSYVTRCNWEKCWGAEKAETSKIAWEFSLHKELVGVWGFYYMRKAKSRGKSRPGDSCLMQSNTSRTALSEQS